MDINCKVHHLPTDETGYKAVLPPASKLNN